MLKRGNQKLNVNIVKNDATAKGENLIKETKSNKYIIGTTCKD